MADRERRTALFRRHLDLRVVPQAPQRDVEPPTVQPVPEVAPAPRKKRARRRTLSWVRPDEPLA
jgi:hypothetical protein